MNGRSSLESALPTLDGDDIANDVTFKETITELSAWNNVLVMHKRFVANIVSQLKALGDKLTIDERQTLLPDLHVACSGLQRVDLNEVLKDDNLVIYLFHCQVARSFETLNTSIQNVVKQQIKLDESELEELEFRQDLLDSDRRTDDIETEAFLRRTLRNDDVVERARNLSEPSIALVIQGLEKLTWTTSNSNTTELLKKRIAQFKTIRETLISSNLRSITVPLFPVQSLTFQSEEQWEGCYSTTRRARLKNGPLVAVKSLSPSLQWDRDAGNERLKRDLHIWGQLRHENILTLLGVTKLDSQDLRSMVSPWVTYGSSNAFLAKFPDSPRLPILQGVLRGLAYLHSHSPPIVHGDLRGSHILVSEEGNPLLSGFSLAYIPGHQYLLLDDLVGGISFRWMAYELLETDRIFEPSEMSDMWAFAMVVIEVITGMLPFAEYERDTEVLIAIRYNMERPARPVEAGKRFGLSDQIWSLLQQCWDSNPRNRPTVDDALKIFNEAVDLMNEEKLETLGVPYITESLDPSRMPESYRDAGMYGEIRQCWLKDGTPVAVKTLRHMKLKVLKIEHSKRFRREVTIWGRLKHENILPLLGLVKTNDLSSSLVSPWIEPGNCHTFLSNNPQTPRLPMIRGIIQGLAYLHKFDPPVIHGDLRGPNILVTTEGIPLLCDFGLSVITEELSQLPISTVLQGSGNCRWMARELLFGDGAVSLEADIWAFGMVIIEILTSSIPYSDLKNDAQVVLAIHGGKLPQRPEASKKQFACPDQLWSLVTKCLMASPGMRPSAAGAAEVVNAVIAIEQ